MRKKLILRLWGPGGEERDVELQDESRIRSELASWAMEIGCRVGDLDYQINDGLRVLGEASARRRAIDVCGLPRKK